MKHLKYLLATTAGAAVLAVSAMGVASAASNYPNHENIGTSGIPRSVFKQERLDAEAQVLNTTVANVQAAHKNKTFGQLITNANLTKKTFAQKLKAQLTSDLESKGYSQNQITIALQHKIIGRLYHHMAR